MTLGLGRWPMWIALLMVLGGVGLRVAAASQPGLWADEIFSLAMATGHSLEHPADDADATLGDYVELPGPVEPAVLRRYTEHEAPPAGPARVVRAVLKSDTNAPLYYLILDPWTRLFGTGDGALRLFSVAWAMLSLPLIWLLGRDIAGHRTAWSASVLFALSPVAIYYSTEGRMYSLLWFLALGLAWLTVRISGDDRRAWHVLLWVLAGAAGLLTHYFFVFVWLPCAAWLWFEAPRARRRRVALLVGVTLLAVLPWYVQIPESLGRWRVTGGWQDGDLGWPRALGRPFALAGSLLSGRTYLGGWEHAGIALGAIFLMAAVLVARREARGPLSGPLMMLWACLAGACFGPLAFDLLRHTTTSDQPRYVLAGLPAALLLAAVGLSRISRTSPPLHVGLLAAMLLAWLPGIRDIVATEAPRPWEPYAEIDARITARVGPAGLVLVRLTPSRVIGIARYLEQDVSLVPWVPALNTRDVEADLDRLIVGHRLVALVKVSSSGPDEPVEAWLQAHARPMGRDTFQRSSSEVLYFAPLQGETFEPAAAN